MRVLILLTHLEITHACIHVQSHGNDTIYIHVLES